MKKTFVLGVVLSLSSLFAGQKSFDVVFSSPAKVAGQDLKAGTYKVKVDGNTAVFTDQNTQKTVTAPVKVGTGEKKFKFTAVDANKEGEVSNVNAIEVGGSTTRLEFAK